MDWQSEIFMAAMVKQQVADADRLKIWEHPLPEPAAGEAEIAAVEQAQRGLLGAVFAGGAGLPAGRRLP